MMGSIDLTIVSVALPTMLRELDTSLALASWTLTASQLTQTVTLPLAGKLADKFGRKRLFLCSVALFCAGSIGSGVAPSIYLLILCRVAQASGAAMFFPCAASIVGDVFEEGRQVAIGLFVTIFQLGGVIGPNIGGLITDHLSWRWVFFVNVPVSVVVVLLGIALLPKDKTPDESTRPHIDTYGAALFAAGMFSVLFGLTHLANHPDDLAAPLPWFSMACGVALLLAFVRQESRTAEPIIDLKLLRWRPFLACNAQLFMWSGAFNGFFNFIPYYATIAYGMSATEAGAILTPRSLAAVIVSFVSSIFVGRMGYRRPWLTGIYMMATSMFLMSLGLDGIGVLGLEVSPFVLLCLITGLGGVAIGVAIPPSQNAYFDLVPDQMATAAGFRAMFGNSGAVFVTALVTLTLSQFSDKVLGFHVIFAALGCLVLLSQIWAFMVPEKPKRPVARDTGPATISRP